MKRRKIELKRYLERFQRGYDGIMKCLSKTEETQDVLAKEAPILVEK